MSNKNKGKKVYQVWVLGYSECDMIRDYSAFLYESSDIGTAIEYAKNVTGQQLKEKLNDKDSKILRVQVETVVVDRYGAEENIDTIYESVWHVTGTGEIVKLD